MKNKLWCISKDKCLFVLYSLLMIVLMNFRGLFPAGVLELTFTMFIMTKIYNSSVIIEKQDFLLLWVMLLFCLVCTLAIFTAIQPELVFRNVFYYLFGIIIFLSTLLFFHNKPQEFFRFLISYVVITALVGLVTFLALCAFYGASKSSFLLYERHGLARGAGFHGNPNYYSLSQMLSFCCALVLNEVERSRKTYILILVTLVGVVASVSRGAIIASFAGLFLFLVFQRRYFAIICSAAVISLVMIVLLSSNIEALQQLLESRLSDGGGGAQDRFNSIVDGVSAVGDNLLLILFGLGGNNFINYSDYAPHNSYFRVFFENGAIASLILIFAFIFIIFRKGLRISRSSYFVAPFMIMALTNDIFVLKEFWLAVGIYYVYVNSVKGKPKANSPL